MTYTSHSQRHTPRTHSTLEEAYDIHLSLTAPYPTVSLLLISLSIYDMTYTCALIRLSCARPLSRSLSSVLTSSALCTLLQDTATHCNALQHAATHCNTLQHTATHCNTLQHTAQHCNTLQRTATHCSTLQHTTDLICTPHTKIPSM